MAITNTGKTRLFGRATMARVTELKRQAVIGHSEAFGPEPADDDSFPFSIDVLRRVQTAPGDPAAGIGPTYENAPGLSGLTGRIRSAGRWYDEAIGTRTIAQDERMAFILDVPATDGVREGTLLPTDHIAFEDATRGNTVWEVVGVRNHPRDGIVAALVRYVRERT